MQKSSEKQGRPGIIHNVSDVRRMQGGRRGGRGRSHFNRSWIKMKLYMSEVLERLNLANWMMNSQCLNLFAVGPHPPRTPGRPGNEATLNYTHKA